MTAASMEAAPPLVHGEQRFTVVGWMGYYRACTPGVRCASRRPEPKKAGDETLADAALFRDSTRDVFATEVAASSLPIDRGAKLRLYRRNGVQEYLLWDARGRAIEWFALREGQYETLAPGPDGILRSVVFPGLWLDAAALIAADLPRLLAVLGAGIASPEHAAFVAALAAA